MRNLIGCIIIFFAMACLLTAFSKDDVVMTQCGIRGKVSVNRNKDGTVESVKITGSKDSYTIAQTSARALGADSTMHITQAQVDKLASYEGQTIRVYLRLVNYKPVDVSSPTVTKGEDPALDPNPKGKDDTKKENQSNK